MHSTVTRMPRRDVSRAPPRNTSRAFLGDWYSRSTREGGTVLGKAERSAGVPQIVALDEPSHSLQTMITLAICLRLASVLLFSYIHQMTCGIGYDVTDQGTVTLQQSCCNTAGGLR